MWWWIKDRLDRRWKRVAFILWLPVVAITVLISVYALLHIYIVDFGGNDNGNIFDCHRQVAGDAPGSPDPEKHQMAMERYRSRFSAETREVENSPAFMRCITAGYNGDYWLNYHFIVSEAGRWIFWTLLFALVIFPHFWRKIGNALGGWITMRT